MSTAPTAITAQEVAKGLSMFEIDEALDALVEAAEQEAEANNGEITDGIKTALATYAEAFGYKVDRIAHYLKAQESGSGVGPMRGRALPGTMQIGREPREAPETDARMVYDLAPHTEVARCPEYDQPTCQQHLIAGDTGDFPDSGQLLPSKSGAYMA